MREVERPDPRTKKKYNTYQYWWGWFTIRKTTFQTDDFKIVHSPLGAPTDDSPDRAALIENREEGKKTNNQKRFKYLTDTNENRNEHISKNDLR